MGRNICLCPKGLLPSSPLGYVPHKQQSFQVEGQWVLFGSRNLSTWALALIWPATWQWKNPTLLSAKPPQINLALLRADCGERVQLSYKSLHICEELLLVIDCSETIFISETMPRKLTPISWRFWIIMSHFKSLQTMFCVSEIVIYHDSSCQLMGSRPPSSAVSLEGCRGWGICDWPSPFHLLPSTMQTFLYKELVSLCSLYLCSPGQGLHGDTGVRGISGPL